MSRKVVGYPPLSELGDLQRREFHDALLEAAAFEDLPGKWQAAILEAEQDRPKLRVASRRLKPAAEQQGRQGVSELLPPLEDAGDEPARKHY